MKDTRHSVKSASHLSSPREPRTAGSDVPEEGADANNTGINRRPVWIILFAAILILITTKAKADEGFLPSPSETNGEVSAVSPAVNPVAQAVHSDAAALEADESKPARLNAESLNSHASMTIELNGETYVITPAHQGFASPEDSSKAQAIRQVAHQTIQDRHQAWRDYANSRPAYVQLAAHLANFDADGQPDGWQAELVVRDREDRPIAVNGRAKFQLTPRVLAIDFLNYVDADQTPMTWSEPIEFDEDGVARFKLPLRQPLPSHFAWASSLYPELGLRSQRFGGPAWSRRSGVHGRYLGSQRHGSAMASGTRNGLGQPDFGELKVRVSIPGEGIFEAVTVTPIRPSVLVDTHWPYR